MKNEKLDIILDHLYGELEPEAEESFINESLSSKSLTNRTNETRRLLTAYRLGPIMEIPKDAAEQALQSLKNAKAEEEAKHLENAKVIEEELSKEADEDKSPSNETTQNTEQDISEPICTTKFPDSLDSTLPIATNRRRLSFLSTAALVILGLGVGYYIFTDNSTAKKLSPSKKSEIDELSLNLEENDVNENPNPEKLSVAQISAPDHIENIPEIEPIESPPLTNKEKVEDILEEIDEISLSIDEKELEVVDRNDKLQYNGDDTDLLNIKVIDGELEVAELEFVPIEKEFNELLPDLDESNEVNTITTDSKTIEKYVAEIAPNTDDSEVATPVAISEAQKFNSTSQNLQDNGSSEGDDLSADIPEIEELARKKAAAHLEKISQQENFETRLNEQTKQGEKEHLEKVAKQEEETRLAEIAKHEEETHLAEIARQNEEARLAKIAKQNEETRLAKIAKHEEEARLAEIAKQEEETRLAEIAKQEEEARLAEIAKQEEEARLAKIAKQKEEARLAEIAKQEEEARLAKIAKQEEEARLAKIAKQEEEARLAKIAKQEEEARLTKIAKQEEEARLAEIAKQEEEARLAKIAKQEEEARLAKIAKQEEEARLTKIAKQEEEARLAKIAKQKEEARLAEIAKQKEEARLAKIAKQKEEARLAEIAKQKEEARLAKIAKQKEEARLAKIAKQNEEARLAEIAKHEEEANDSAVKIVEPILTPEGLDLYSNNQAPKMALRPKKSSPVAIQIKPENTTLNKLEFKIDDTAADLISKAETLYIKKSYLQALFGVEEALTRSPSYDDRVSALTLKARIEQKLNSYSDMKSTIDTLRPLSPLDASALQVLYNAGVNHIKNERRRETKAAQPEKVIIDEEPAKATSYIIEKSSAIPVAPKPQMKKKSRFNPTTDTYYKRK